MKLIDADGSVASPLAGRELMVAIENHVVPRLVLAHGLLAPTPPRPATPLRESTGPQPTEADVRELVEIAAGQDLSAAVALVESVHDRGVSIDTVMLQLVEPAAHSLKAQWESNLRTLTEVTIGRGTLQLLIHVVGARFTRVADQRGLVVLVASPSERLSLGIYVYEEFLRRDGCDLVVEPGISKPELLALIGSERVMMLGISATRADIFEPLARLVAAARKASVNPAVAVVLNGPADLSDAAKHVGAALCSDPRDASHFIDSGSSTFGKRQGR